ncbi:MAG: PAS domain S-box protein [Anaerolineales bacterium]
MSTPIRILIVEDRAADAELILHELQQAGFDSDWQRVETEPDFLAGLETNPDLILVDWSLPQFSGLRVLQLLNEYGQDIPFIIVSGVIGEEAAVDAIRMGAADYVMKDRPARLGQAVHNVLEYKQVQVERRLAEERLRYQANLLANVNDAIIATDSQYRITTWNAAAEALYGWKSDEVLGRNVMEITRTEWPEEKVEAMRRTIAEAKRWRGEATQVRRDGSRFYIEASIIVLTDDSGQITGYVSVGRDITERKRAEDVLRESEGKYRTLFEGSSQGILATDIETNRFIDANPSICRMFGYSKEELLRLGIMEIHPQEAQDEIKSGMERQKQKGRSLSPEVPCLRKDGTIFYADVSGATTVIHGRRCIVGFFVDVTERKRADQALKDSEKRFRDIADNAQEFIWEVDAQGKYTYASQMVEKVLGYTPQEILHKYFYDLFHPEDREALKTAALTAFAAKQSLREFINRNVHKNGQTIWLSTSALPLLDDKGNLLGYRGADTDITDHKRAEEALSHSHEETAHANRMLLALGQAAQAVQRAHKIEDVYSTIQSQVTQLGYITTGFELAEDGYSLYIAHVSNKADLIRKAEKATGLSLHDFRFRPKACSIYQRVLADRETVFVPDITQAVAEALPGKLRLLGRTITNLLKLEQAIFTPLVVAAQPIGILSIAGSNLTEADIPAITAFANQAAIALENARLYERTQQEITERKRSEDALRESEQKYRTLVENIPQKIFMKDRELKYLSSNENYTRDLGIQPADILGKTDYDFYPKDLAEKYRADDLRIIETAQLEELEENYHQEGRETWIHTIKTPVKNENGEIVALLGIFYDITERKRGEEKLEEERILLRTLIDNLPDRIYVKDVQGHKIVSNRADWLASGGKTMEDIIGKTDFDVYPPELAEAYWALDKAVMDSGISIINREESGLDSQGNSVQILTSKVPLRDGNGRVVGLVGIGRDITERKQAELALQDSEQKYRLLVDNASEAIVVAQDGILKFVNRMAIDLTGYSEQELTLRPFSEFIHLDDRGMVIERFLSRIKGDVNIPKYSFRLMARDGKIKWVEITAVLIDWEVKPATLNFLTDITERKQVELVREVLYTISQAAVTENLEDFYLSFHHALGNLMPVDNFYIALYDPKADLISFPYAVDEHDESFAPQKPGRGLTEYILRTGRPLLVDRKGFTQLVQQGEVDLVGIDSVEWLGVPLKVGEKIFGVIAVQSYTESVRFSQADMEVLGFVSSQVTTFIDRKLAQQRIADALEFNNTLINSSSVGISAYNVSGQCILANKAIASILGATRSQILGQNYKHIKSWKKSGLLEVAREAAASGKETRREIHTKSEFGREIWLDCQFTPFVSNGEPHLLRIVEDISNAKQDEIALQAYAIKLEQSNRDLQEFAYVASHDLQEPLRKVLAFSDLIINEYGDAVDETGRDYLNRMQGASQRMQTLITDLLNFSRVETRARPFIEVDLNTVAQEVVSDLENSIERTQGRVEIGKLPTIEVDPTQMHQLLQNLIGNGLKFRHEGCSPLVKVSAKINGDTCQISVEDNGIGFNIQYLDRIFKPFERLHSREEYEGSGMGLAICRRIVERHGGSITATSTPGEESTFIVTLPIHQSKGDSSHE